MKRSYSLNIKNPIRRKHNPSSTIPTNISTVPRLCDSSSQASLLYHERQIGSSGDEGGSRMRLFPGSLQSGILSKSACYLHLSEDGSIPIINAMSMIDLGPNNGGEGDYTNRASWIRIAVLGHKSVGKTGRFIWEYSPLERVYIHKTLSNKDNSPVWVEIRDMAFTDEESLLSEVSSNWICDGYLLVFSLTDEASLPLALRLAQTITKEAMAHKNVAVGSRHQPVLLVASKSDLHHLLPNTAALTLRDKCQGFSWSTTSAKEDSSSVQEAFNSLIQLIFNSRLDSDPVESTLHEDWNTNVQSAGSLLSPGTSATSLRKRKPSTRIMESFNKMFGGPKCPGKS